MSNYADTIKALESTCGQTAGWSDISPEHAARMRLQNRFQDGARYCPLHGCHHAQRHGRL